MSDEEQNNLRAKIVIGMRMRTFNANPTLENAQGVFLACREYKIEFPEPILEYFTNIFQSNYDQHRQKRREQIEKYCRKEEDKQTILLCFLESNSQDEACIKYLKETVAGKIKESEIRAVRIKAERYLREIYPEDKNQPLSKLLARYRMDITE